MCIRDSDITVEIFRRQLFYLSGILGMTILYVIYGLSVKNTIYSSVLDIITLAIAFCYGSFSILNNKECLFGEIANTGSNFNSLTSATFYLFIVGIFILYLVIKVIKMTNAQTIKA